VIESCLRKQTACYCQRVDLSPCRHFRSCDPTQTTLTMLTRRGIFKYLMRNNPYRSSLQFRCAFQKTKACLISDHVRTWSSLASSVCLHTEQDIGDLQVPFPCLQQRQVCSFKGIALEAWCENESVLISTIVALFLMSNYCSCYQTLVP